MDESQKLMDGNKWKLFMLQLSFFGWALLCGFTFGIGYLWLNPYMQTATAVFYDELVGGAPAGTQTEDFETIVL